MKMTMTKTDDHDDESNSLLTTIAVETKVKTDIETETTAFTTILFSKDFVKEIESTHRLLPTSIGVKRIRPSNKAVLKELKRQHRVKKEKKPCQKDILHFNYVQEDKDNTMDEAEARATCTGSLKRQWIDNPRVDKNNDTVEQECSVRVDTAAVDVGAVTNQIQADPFYHQLEINPAIMQEEIEEMKYEDRRAYNNLPVVLTPPIAYQAYLHGLIHLNNNYSRQKPNCLRISKIVIDDELAARWAQALRKVIEFEETIRNQEDLRPLVYKIVPEVWKRLRPVSLLLPQNNDVNNNNESADSETLFDVQKEMIHCENIRSNRSMQYNTSWYDKSHKIVFECLYKYFPTFHLSCGSKFGCDYLIYDGSRMERHAFAGLRIVCVKNRHLALHEIENNDNIFPLLSPYDLSGYIRGMNTAGKLALLATVLQINGNVESVTSSSSDDVTSSNGEKFHVVIVDLALEKVIISDTTHKLMPKRAKLGRKEVGLNLNKNKYLITFFESKNK